MLKRAVDALRHIFFPPRCACCMQVLPRGIQVCADCAAALHRIKRPICPRCGRSRRHCQCRPSGEAVFYDGCCAPFYYVDAAARGIRQMKFRDRTDSAPFFASAMTASFLALYPRIRPDGIAFVPLTRRRERERGYNQAALLAERIAEELGLPLLDVLVKNRENKIQHDLRFAERLANVRDVYACTADMTGRTVLLVDDIKTTGATLNACAAALKEAGARRVFCVSAAIVPPKDL